MKEGDVVLTPIPQANGRIKNRPVIVFYVNCPLIVIFLSVVSALN